MDAGHGLKTLTLRHLYAPSEARFLFAAVDRCEWHVRQTGKAVLHRLERGV